MSRSTSLCATTLVFAWAAAFAQGRAPDAPAPGQGTGAPPGHVSPLRDYRAFADEPVTSWREANETVRHIGGWQAYSRESYEALRKPAQQPPARRELHDAHHGAKQ